MLKQGELLEDKYRVEKVLFESRTTEYYLAFKAMENIPVIISTCSYNDTDDLENRIQELKSVNKYIDSRILKILECFQKDSWLFIVQEAPKGSSVKDRIMTQGPFERKTALMISIEIANLFAELFGRWPRRLINDFSSSRVYFTDDKKLELIAADQIQPMTELGKDGEKECIRALGLTMYQISTGVNDLSSFHQNQVNTLEVPFIIPGFGKKYSEVIRKCITAEYADLKNPFKQISKELKQAKLFDGLFGFSTAENKNLCERTKEAANRTDAESENQFKNQNVSQIESDTVRLDQVQYVPETVKKNSAYSGRFDIVRSDMWIHTREII